jgi:hypothetical protein
MAGFEPAASASRTLRANQAALLPVATKRIRRGRHENWVGQIRAVLVGPTGEEGFHRSAEPDGIQGLEQPAVGVATTGQEDVGPAVKEDQNGGWLGPTRPRFEAEVVADGEGAHAADLLVEDHQIRVDLEESAADLGSGRHSMNAKVRPSQDRPDLVPDPRSVAGDQNVRHEGRVPPDPGRVPSR